MRTVMIDGKKYRVHSSTIGPESKFDRLRAAFLARGVAEEVNALPPGKRNRFVLVHIMTDGTAKIANSLTRHQAAVASHQK